MTSTYVFTPPPEAKSGTVRVTSTPRGEGEVARPGVGNPVTREISFRITSELPDPSVAVSVSDIAAVDEDEVAPLTSVVTSVHDLINLEYEVVSGDGCVLRLHLAEAPDLTINRITQTDEDDCEVFVVVPSGGDYDERGYEYEVISGNGCLVPYFPKRESQAPNLNITRITQTDEDDCEVFVVTPSGGNYDAFSLGPRQAAAEAVVQNGAVSRVNIIDGGLRYGLAPLVTIIGDGEGARAVAKIDVDNGSIVSIDVLDRGSGYTIAQVAIPEPDKGVASLQAFVSNGGELSRVDVLSGGAGYDSNSSPILYFPTPDGGTQAIGKAIISNGTIQQVVMITNGSGYNTAPATPTLDPEYHREYDYEIISGSGCLVPYAVKDEAVAPNLTLTDITGLNENGCAAFVVVPSGGDYDYNGIGPAYHRQYDYEVVSGGGCVVPHFVKDEAQAPNLVVSSIQRENFVIGQVTPSGGNYDANAFGPVEDLHFPPEFLSEYHIEYDYEVISGNGCVIPHSDIPAITPSMPSIPEPIDIIPALPTLTNVYSIGEDGTAPFQVTVREGLYDELKVSPGQADPEDTIIVEVLSGNGCIVEES